MKKKLIYYTIILLSVAEFGYTQSEKQKFDPDLLFKKGNLTAGAYIAIGYNVLSHVDGTLLLIPNNISPDPEPGTPVWSSPLSINIQSPSLAIEYWYQDTWSVRSEMGVNIIVLGSTHALSDFAYILVYFKMLLETRFYFEEIFFVGMGMFVDLPIVKPLTGFTPAKTDANVTFGPTIELGANYPLTKTIAIESGLRFSFSVLPYTNKSNPKILTTLNSAPLDFGVGINYKLS